MPRPRPLPADPIRFLSFSGGGWNSHSNLAGVFAASMNWQTDNNTQRDVGDLLSEYDYISANSGGTWFLTALGFSPDYLQSLTDKNRADNYTTTGFIGQVKNAYENLGIPYLLSRDETLGSNYVINTAFNSDWAKLVKKLVYNPIIEGLNGPERRENDISQKRFEGQQLADWASGKHLTYATTLAKSSSMRRDGEIPEATSRLPIANITPDGRFQNGYYAYADYIGPQARGTPFLMKGANFYPLSIEISKASTDEDQDEDRSLYRIPGSIDQGKARAVFGYGTNYPPVNGNNWAKSSKLAEIPGEGEASTNLATAPSIASSSAAAFMAVPEFYPRLISNRTSISHRKNAPIAMFKTDESNTNMIIGAELDQSTRQQNAKENYKEIIKNAYTRLGDGGFGDNTSLAYNFSAAVRQAYSKRDSGMTGTVLQRRREKQLTKFTQEGARNDKFEATLFHNNSESLNALGTINNQKIPNDVLDLFGAGSWPRASSETTWTSSNWIENPYNLIKNTAMQTTAFQTGGMWQISPQIFETDSLTGLSGPNGSVNTGLQAPDWEFKSEARAGSEGVHLQYWRLPVRTVNNEAYGIKKGIGGHLNLFISLNPESSAMPYKASIHDEYIENYKAWQNGMNDFSTKYQTNFLQADHGHV